MEEQGNQWSSTRSRPVVTTVERMVIWPKTAKLRNGRKAHVSIAGNKGMSSRTAARRNEMGLKERSRRKRLLKNLLTLTITKNPKRNLKKRIL